MYILKTQPQYLKREIKFFYSARIDGSQHTPVAHRRLPDGTLDIVFNLHKPAYISKDEKYFELMPDIALTGLYTNKCFLQYEDKMHIVGAVFQPGFAHLFINDTLEHHKAATKDAAKIFGNDIYALQAQMHEIKTERAKHMLLEKYFLRLRRAKNSNYSISNIENAVSIIHKRNGAVSINDLCKQQFMSERNFRRKFIEYVGMPPKKYAAIIRIKSFCLLHRSGMNYNECTNYLEFTDQSHLHKEFNKIVGINPEHFFSEMSTIGEKFLQF